MPERRMLVGGKLLDAQNGQTFDNVNPATEQVLGQVADGSRPDMERAVSAARIAFDNTDWARDHAGRRQALLQLQAALESEREQLRSELVAEVGCPVSTTTGRSWTSPCEKH